jgi:hypothetical protein
VAAEAVAGGKRLAAARGAWICFQDEAGQTLRPPKARTWARRGHTPVVKVAGSGSGGVSITGLVCLKPGRRGRLIWRVISHHGRKGERSSFGEADYVALLDNVHQRLGTPIVLVWDNLNTHVSAAMRVLIEARGLADRDPATRLRAGPQPHRRRLGTRETRLGQPRCAPRRSPRRSRQTPAAGHPTSARPDRRVPCPDRNDARPGTAMINQTSAIQPL